jgi:hypothetical protein
MRVRKTRAVIESSASSARRRRLGRHEGRRSGRRDDHRLGQGIEHRRLHCGLGRLEERQRLDVARRQHGKRGYGLGRRRHRFDRRHGLVHGDERWLFGRRRFDHGQFERFEFDRRTLDRGRREERRCDGRRLRRRLVDAPRRCIGLGVRRRRARQHEARGVRIRMRLEQS